MLEVTHATIKIRIGGLVEGSRSEDITLSSAMTLD